MVSLARTIRHARYLGLKEWYRSMWYIGDAKKGKLATRLDIAGTGEAVWARLSAWTGGLESVLLHGIVCLSRTASLLPLLGEAAWGGDSPHAALHAQQRTGEPHTDCPVGTDQFGNRYFENLDATEEVPGRHRWVDYAQHDYNATQVPRGWSSWLHHIRLLPPPEDKVMEACKQPWQVPYHENLTGTRGRFITYSTQAPKMSAWEPKVKPRA
ncbi:uncharacterized protein EHS24_007158 [Apiotrichum porosum]|uniref:NADH dehydrogenase [ubiquinone] 1 alpha subcomplex subunit n=1 Tax=Apiotrichum porosum TaxID=105984 RepID=A0A427XXB2_9TREE|nr:uncharacterized protein EHS24_007158 [Apiotrichum porosum]RSH83473.1 hypothetical protein EHS24_007158 [Apiotrichum porosum]